MGKFGVHSARFTFYLFSILGGGDYPNVKRDARHANDDCAMGYVNDAQVLVDEIRNSVELSSREIIYKS